ncbi:NAD-dependent epimerase/dehydratase family protein [Streptosporangium sp. DT93]|uniref:NAD-dependent epimerase/dehydratase family protein n=1 Tax=Streptosporangium sp. DT93 TaxID=3393428 RepID=UPI003CF3244F
MRVMVTGSAGFIGSHVAEAFRAAGHEVAGLDLRTGEDLRDPSVLDRLLPGTDLVVHQAAKVGLGVDVADLPGYASVNVYGTAVLLAAMARHGIGRLVLASSMVVYGEGAYGCAEHGPVRPGPRSEADLGRGMFEPPCPRCGTPLVPATIGEDAPADPRNAYATTKLAQEHLAANWARETGGRAVALRYHNVYGPRMPRDTPYSGVAAVFRSLLEAGRAPRVFEDGRQRRDFVHVRDVAAANLAAARALADPVAHAAAPAPAAPAAPAASAASAASAAPVAPVTSVAPGTSAAYNVASGTPRTIGELAAALAAERGGPAPVVTGEYRLGDVRHVVASPGKARAELGFRAEVGFEEGLREFATAPLGVAP